jgi:hypothetical protein
MKILHFITGVRIFLILLLSAIYSLDVYPQKNSIAANTVGTNVFPYRGWSIAVDAEQLDVEELYFNTALKKAQEYKINTIELHDFVMKGGIVEALIKYDSFPRLGDTLTYNSVQLSRAEKEKYAHRFKRMLVKARQQNLSINIWYHVLRDIPEEVLSMYPEITNIESGFIWKYLDNTFTEFFQTYPEVTRITLTSLHETPSILNNVGGLSREEVLLKLYMTIYSVCKKFGKELVLRDFIISQKDFDSFWKILDRLPDEIYIMTKSVLADWSHVDLANNPVMHRYQNKRLIVEFDLYGEWSGRGDFPVCYPDDIIRHLRAAKALNATGAIGRLIHDDRPASKLPFKTIFESPLDINVYTFSKYISEPIPWLGETFEKWDEDIEAIDKSYWMQWAKRKYNEKNAVPIVRILERTSEINKLTFNIAGRSFRYYIWYPTLNKKHPSNSEIIVDTRNVFQMQLAKVGIEYLRDEKKRALKLVKESIAELKTLQHSMSQSDYKLLVDLFQGVMLIVQAYENALEAFYFLTQSKQASNNNNGNKIVAALKSLSRKIDKIKGYGWYFDLSNDMRILAQEVDSGMLPLGSTFFSK